MPLPTDQVPAPDDVMDWGHLDRATMGDLTVAAEVLTLFHRQAGDLIAAIRELPPETGRLVHSLKGAARGVGARRVAEAAEHLEAALGDPPAARLAADRLGTAVAEARAAIASHIQKA